LTGPESGQASLLTRSLPEIAFIATRLCGPEASITVDSATASRHGDSVILWSSVIRSGIAPASAGIHSDGIPAGGIRAGRPSAVATDSDSLSALARAPHGASRSRISIRAMTRVMVRCGTRAGMTIAGRSIRAGAIAIGTGAGPYMAATGRA